MYLHSDRYSPEEMYTIFTCLRVMPVEKTELTATNVRLGAFSLSGGKFAVCSVWSTISFIPRHHPTLTVPGYEARPTINVHFFHYSILQTQL